MVQERKRQSFFDFNCNDILTVLCAAAVPIALGIYTAITYQQEKENEQRMQEMQINQTVESRRDKIYDNFLKNVYNLDRYGYLNESKDPWAFANAYYRAAHRQLDPDRKGDVLQFLKERQLIGRNNCTEQCGYKQPLKDIIRLNELSFDSIRFKSQTGTLTRLNLKCISFDQVSMKNTTFLFANLDGVSFDNSRLQDISFGNSSLVCARFNNTEIENVDFGDADLTGAIFINVDPDKLKLTSTQRDQAKFYSGLGPQPTTTTTTTVYRTCSSHRWNQTGKLIQGISDRPYSSPLCLSIDSNDTIYICDHTDRNVEAWFKGAISRTKVTDTNHADYLIFDKNGYFYVNEHIDHTVRRYSTNSIIGTVVAGVTGTSSSALNNFNYPLGIDIDDNLNLYVADRDNKRVMKWAPNATAGTLLINMTASNLSTISVSALRLVKNSPNQVYLGDIGNGKVYLWSFGSTNPDLILNQVRNSTALSSPRSLILDQDGNLYVGENGGKGRIIRYCPNSTIGEIMIDDSNGNSAMRKVGIAFDSQQNLYALLGNGKVIKYALL